MTALATSSQLISPLPPDVDPTALVPVDKEHANDHVKSNLSDNPHFAEFLNKIADYATAQANSPAQWERRRKTVLLRKYILGYFYGIYDHKKGFTAGDDEGDGIYFDPQTPTTIDSLVASLVKTKPQKKCEARSGDERIDKKEAARVAERLLQIDDEQDFKPKRQQREWKWNLLAGGETYRITHFNAQKPGCGYDKQVFEKKVIEGGDVAQFCVLCGNVGADEQGKCSNCGNPQVDEYKVLGTTISVNKGTQFEQVGDVDWDSPDSLEMTVIGDTDDIAEALIVRRERAIPKCVLEDALGVDDVPNTPVPDSLGYKQLFESDKGDGSLEAMKPTLYEELWVAPALLASYKFPEDTKLEGGKTIKKGSSGKKAFENGLYMSRTGKKIRIVFPQSIGECLSHTVNSIGEGFHGQGEWDLIPLQDQATEAHSMKMNSMLLDSTQPLMIRKGYVDTENFENKFGLIVEVGEELGIEVPLKNLMDRIPAGQGPREAYSLGEEIKGQIQQRAGTFSTQSDAPDVKAMGTATGIEAIQEQAVGRRGPALQLYAQMEVDQAYQKLELRQKYWCKKMYAPIAKELGGDAIKWFMECNIRQDINISVVPGSWMPQTETQKKNGLREFLSISGEIIAAKGDPKLMDDILRKANDLFGAGVNFSDYQTESVEAQLRIDKLIEVGTFVEQQYGEGLYGPEGNISEDALEIAYRGTAEMLKIIHDPADAIDIFAELPLDVMFDTHSEFEEHYTDWLRTAHGRDASLFIRTLVRQLADYHVQAEAYRQLKLKQYANVTMMPDLEASLTAKDAEHAQGLEHQSQMADQTMQQAAAQEIGSAALQEQLAPPPEPPPVDRVTIA